MLDRTMCEHVLKEFNQEHDILIVNELSSVRIEAEDFHKMIFHLETETGGSYIVKLHHSKPMKANLIEEQSLFSEKLRLSGVNTAERFCAQQVYTHLIQFKGKPFYASLERFLGDEVKLIDQDRVDAMATLMAQMHNSAEELDLHLSTGTIWSLLNPGADVSRGYSYFQSLNNMPICDNSKFDQLIFQDITTLYDKRLWNFEKAHRKLPMFAVQGDFSTNNLTINDNGLGIFDYHIAGEEVLICDAIVQGMFISREMALHQNLTDADRPNLFDRFMRVYQEGRLVSQIEKDVMNDIYALADCFWFTAILSDENSFKKYVEKDDVYAVNHFMDTIWKQLSTDKFSKERS